MIVVIGILVTLRFSFLANVPDNSLIIDSKKLFKWNELLLFALIPICIDVLLDSNMLNQGRDLCRTWISRVIIISSIFIPRIFATFNHELYNSNIVSSPIYSIHLITLAGGLLLSMFDHKFTNHNNSNDIFPIVIERRTIYTLLTTIFASIFRLVHFSTPSITNTLQYISIALYGFAALHFAWILCHVIVFLFRQSTDYLHFQSDVQMRDFYNSVLSLLYLFAVILAYLISSNHPLQLNIWLTMNQMAFIILFKLIIGRSRELRADINEQKLQMRLDLIRYISHELRTPLNTAFMGLNLLNGELNKMQSYLQNNNFKLSYDDNTAIAPFAEEPNQRILLDVSADICKNNCSSPIKDMIETSEQISSSCNVAIETLNDLLTFDKLEESKLDIEFDDVNPWIFLKNTVKPFEINASVAKVDLRLTCKNFVNEQMNAHDIESGEWRYDDYHIKCDKFKLSQVIRNLLSNALKFTRADGKVEVTMEKVPNYHDSTIRVYDEAFDDLLRISVTDSGHGISKENQRKLFGQYVQFNAAKLQQGKGSGLGLWISKNIMDLHHGRIAAYSDGEGKGSTFFLELPLYKMKEENDDKSIHTIIQKLSKSIVLPADQIVTTLASKRPSSFFNNKVSITNKRSSDSLRQQSDKSDEVVMPIITNEQFRSEYSSSRLENQVKLTSSIQQLKSGQWSHKLNILVVDDSLLNRKLAKKLLISHGHNVEECENGQELVSLLVRRNETKTLDNDDDDDNDYSIVPYEAENNDRNYFDVILLDDHMPVMSGPEAVAIVRKNGYKGLVIGVTGDAYPDQIENFKKQGVNQVLCKPLNMDLLRITYDDFNKSNNIFKNEK
eukprot:gene6124-8442_t